MYVLEHCLLHSQADLNDPSSLPAALVGIHTVIDCSTARPEEPTNKIDWEGKVALIQTAQVTLLTVGSLIALCMELLMSWNCSCRA